MYVAYLRARREIAIFVVYLLITCLTNPVVAAHDDYFYHGEALKPRTRPSVDFGKPQTVILAKRPLSSGELKQFHAYRQLNGRDVDDHVVDFEIWAENETHRGMYTLVYRQEVLLPAQEGRHDVNVSGSPKVHPNYYVGFTLRSRMAPFANDPGVNRSVLLVQPTNDSRVGSAVVARPHGADSTVYSVGATVAQGLPKPTASTARKRLKCKKKSGKWTKKPGADVTLPAPTAASMLTDAPPSSLNIAYPVSTENLAQATWITTTVESQHNLSTAIDTQLRTVTVQEAREDVSIDRYSTSTPQTTLDQGHISTTKTPQPSTENSVAALTTTTKSPTALSDAVTTIRTLPAKDSMSTTYDSRRQAVTTHGQTRDGVGTTSKAGLQQRDESTVATTRWPLTTNGNITEPYQQSGGTDTYATSSPQLSTDTLTKQLTEATHIKTTTNKSGGSSTTEQLFINASSSSVATASQWQNAMTTDSGSTAADKDTITTTQPSLFTNDKITGSQQLPGNNNTAATSPPQLRGDTVIEQSTSTTNIELTSSKADESSTTEKQRLDANSSSDATASQLPSTKTADGGLTTVLTTPQYHYRNSTPIVAEQPPVNDSDSTLPTTGKPRDSTGGENSTQRHLRTESHGGTTTPPSRTDDQRSTTSGTLGFQESGCTESQHAGLSDRAVGEGGCTPTRTSTNIVSSASSTPSNTIGWPNGASSDQGEKGDKGEVGHRGLTGPDGSAGPSGRTGMRGLHGPTGLPGEPGSRAITGATGTTGVAGHTGYTGRPGTTGDPGASGFPGLPGETGSSGATGAKGDVGPVGPKGAQGNDGSKGTPGLLGAQGTKGQKGEAGPKGFPGISHGPTGPTGAKGEKGEKGTKGSRGKPGEPGDRGEPGFPGRTGADGQTGETGTPGQRGSKGKPGETGDAGPQGPVGSTGEAGVTGTTGSSGTTGLPGPTGISGPEGEPGDPADDIDECSVANGRCPGLCINAAYGFYCLCPTGYSSQNISSSCPENRTYCSETEHGRLCFCRTEEGPATPLNGTTCVDIDECRFDNGGCEHSCKNTPGSFECSCSAGFKIVSKYLCEDIDECSLLNGNCSHVCVNTPGGYYCTCESGSQLSLDRPSVYANQVASRSDCDNLQTLPSQVQADGETCLHNGQIALVARTGGCHVTDIVCKYDHLYHQSCYCLVDKGPTTYVKTLNGTTCEGTNECLIDNGGCAHLCIDDSKGFHCACKPGFALTANGFECQDVDECNNRTLMDQHCKAPAICINNPGGYVCRDMSAMSKAAHIPMGTLEDDRKLQKTIIYATITTCSIISTVTTGALLILTYTKNKY